MSICCRCVNVANRDINSCLTPTFSRSIDGEAECVNVLREWVVLLLLLNQSEYIVVVKKVLSNVSMPLCLIIVIDFTRSTLTRTLGYRGSLHMFMLFLSAMTNKVHLMQAISLVDTYRASDNNNKLLCQRCQKVQTRKKARSTWNVNHWQAKSGKLLSQQ